MYKVFRWYDTLIIEKNIGRIDFFEAGSADDPGELKHLFTLVAAQTMRSDVNECIWYVNSGPIRIKGSRHKPEELYEEASRLLREASQVTSWDSNLVASSDFDYYYKNEPDLAFGIEYRDGQWTIHTDEGYEISGSPLQNLYKKAVAQNFSYDESFGSCLWSRLMSAGWVSSNLVSDWHFKSPNGKYSISTRGNMVWYSLVTAGNPRDGEGSETLLSIEVDKLVGETKGAKADEVLDKINNYLKGEMISV